MVKAFLFILILVTLGEVEHQRKQIVDLQLRVHQLDGHVGP